MLSKKQLIIIVSILILSLISALKLLHIDYMVNYSSDPFKSFCNISATFNCDAVAASQYSSLWGVPIAFYGSFGDLLLLLFVFVALRRETLRAVLAPLLLAVFTLKSAGSLVLAAVALLFMSSHCFVCIFYWVLSWGAWIYLLLICRPWRQLPGQMLRAFKELLGGHKLISAAFFVVYLMSLPLVRHYLNTCSCNLRDPQSLQCLNFDADTGTAFLGSDRGRLDVVIYTDFECPWCSRAHKAVTELVKKYEKQVRFIRRDFPLDMQCNPSIAQPFHQQACRAAYFAKCAGLQGQYWEYHDELYEVQRALSEETFLNIGRLLGLDLEALMACVAAAATRENVADEIREALAFGIRGTPTFRIAGELFTGILAEEALQDYLVNFPALSVGVLRRIFDNRQQENIQLVDLRSADAFGQSRIPGAVNIPLDQLSRKIDAITPERPVLLYDQYGNQSHRAYDYLSRQGFRSVHTLSGGYEKWQASALPGVASSGPVLLSATEARDLAAGGADLILDLRSSQMYQEQHIPGAFNIPLEDLEQRLDELRPYQAGTILIYCRTTNRSLKGHALLKAAGFQNIPILLGGIVAWNELGYPSE